MDLKAILRQAFEEIGPYGVLSELADFAFEKASSPHEELLADAWYAAGEQIEKASERKPVLLVSSLAA